MQDGGLENIWIMDSGCSLHMTGNHRWFSNLTPVSSSEHIIFGDKGTGKVKGVGAVLVSKSFILRDVALVGNLGYNLLSVSQLFEEGYEVRIKKGFSRVLDAQESLVCLFVPFGKVFRVDFLSSSGPSHCLMAGPSFDLWKWHRRLAHLSFDLLAKLSSLDLIRGLPKLKSERDLVCHPCCHGRMVAASHTPVNQVMTARPRELIHMDTVGPSRVRYVGGKWSVLVIVDDFSRWSWVHFLESKDEAFEVEKRIKTCHESYAVTMAWNSRMIVSKLFALAKNGVVECKNRTLVEMARTMVDEHRTPRKFWAKAINTACYVSNHIFLRAVLNKTSYELRFGRQELRFGRQPKVSHQRVFGCRCFVLKQGTWTGDDEIGTTIFEDDEEDVDCSGDTALAAATEPAASLLEDDEGAPVSSPSTTLEQPPLDPPVHAAGSAEDVREVTTEPQASQMVQRDHPSRNIIGGLNERVTRSRSTSLAHFAHSAFVSSFEPHDVGHALSNPNWVNAMHEELENFERNRARLVAQGFCQKEGIDYEDTFAPIARLNAIRILLAFAASKGFKLF
ncbi:hypothetical protein U9M48_003120 [Paspalum notatum var. saurae]|uniref:GAG-pre-integrase domain-containing protein n=1 Tax=Paspalum notatum var. saurae TaxID=547442 RepID=A0AAQ3PKK6_PASNO